MKKERQRDLSKVTKQVSGTQQGHKELMTQALGARGAEVSGVGAAQAPLSLFPHSD